MAFLIVIASLTKSAQFPFHSWLPETMEAPTPVSALMHAGIINAGGALVLRFASLLAAVPESLFLLSLVGTLTMVLGTLSMWAQVKVKRTLAWSTVNQMGFMMVQLGVGAFSAAAIHIFGHGCYKAWSFLRSSELPQPSTSREPVAPRLQLTLVALGVGLSLVWIIRATTWTTGLESGPQLGELALLAIVALSVGHAWAVYLGPRLQGGKLNFGRVLLCIIVSIGAVGVLLGLYHAADWYFAPVWGQAKFVKSPWMWLAAGLPVMASLLLTIIHAHLPTLGASAVGRKLFIHSLHGFYLGAVADRIVDRIWNTLPFTKSLNHASTSR